MPTVFLVRHGRTDANARGVLAGWTPGIGLDAVGAAQALALGTRLAGVRLARIVTSPLQRCQETTATLLSAPDPATRPPEPVIDDRLGECRYGDWTGRPLTELAEDPLWRVVQAHPAAAIFPGPDGESLAAMSHRAVTAVREHDRAVAREDGEDACWLMVSHGDVIKAILADALGVHLDGFQRLAVDPCSVSVVRYTPLRPFLLRLNDTGTDLTGFNSPAAASTARTTADVTEVADAPVGGGSGVNDAPSDPTS